MGMRALYQGSSIDNLSALGQVHAQGQQTRKTAREMPSHSQIMHMQPISRYDGKSPAW